MYRSLLYPLNEAHAEVRVLSEAVLRQARTDAGSVHVGADVVEDFL